MNGLKFCRNCGTPIPPGQSACPNCGTPVNTVAPEPNPAMGNLPQQVVENNKLRNNTLMIVLIAVVGLLVLLVLIFGIVLLTRDKDDSSENMQAATPIEQYQSVADSVATPTAVAEAPLDMPQEQQPAKPKRRSSPYMYVVDGSIGSYKINMDITISGGSIQGRYRYNRMKGKGGWLDLSGTASGGTFQMWEYDKNGNNTGNFSGTYTISGDKLRMSGSMTNAKYDTYSFNVSGGEAGN